MSDCSEGVREVHAIGTTRKHRDFDKLAEVARDMFEALCNEKVRYQILCGATESEAISRTARGMRDCGFALRLRKLGVEVKPCTD